MSEIQEIKKPTIQERIQKRVHEILEPIEVWLDRYVIQPDKFNPDKFKLIDVFKKEQVGGVHARKIMEMYEPQYQEYKDLLLLREKYIPEILYSISDFSSNISKHSFSRPKAILNSPNFISMSIFPSHILSSASSRSIIF